MTLNKPLGPPHLLLICLLCLLVSPLVAQTSFDRYINDVAEKWKRSNHPILDDANMISRSTQQELNAHLVRFQRQTGVAVAVVTLPNMQGGQLEDFTNRLYEKVGLGTAGEDKGTMLLVAQQERKIRIETGYGVEGDLTDLEAKRIIDNLITPAFRANQFSAGIDAGVKAILNEVQPGFVPEPERRKSTRNDGTSIGDFVWFLLIFLLVVLRFINPFALLFGRHRRRGRYRRGDRGIWYRGGGGFGSGGGFSSGGGGGFGGFGGGFSGGGGASGGW